MSAPDRLMSLTEDPSTILSNLPAIREGILDSFTAADTENKRVSLLSLFHASLNLAESKISDQKLLSDLRAARDADYRRMLVIESMVGENVCIETWNRVTLREVAAGRMAPDSETRKRVAEIMLLPHLSRAELIAQMEAAKSPPLPRIPAWRQWIESYGGLAFMAACYLAIPWAAYRISDREAAVFWLVLAALIIARIAFAVVKIVADEIPYRLTRERRIAQVLEFLKQNKFPDPNGKEYVLTRDYYSYIHAIAISEMSPPEIRSLAQREDTFMKTVEPLQDFMTRIRFHSPLDEALKRFKANYPFVG